MLIEPLKVSLLEELLCTLPQWDVPELNLEPGRVYHFRDDDYVVRYENGSITRHLIADLLERIPPSIHPTVRKPAAEVEREYGLQTGHLGVGSHHTDLPVYEIDSGLWESIPRERKPTGGYWRDEDRLYYQLLNMDAPQIFRPMVYEIIASANDDNYYSMSESAFRSLPQWEEFKHRLSERAIGDMFQYFEHVMVKVSDSKVVRYKAIFEDLPF